MSVLAVWFLVVVFVNLFQGGRIHMGDFFYLSAKLQIEISRDNT